MTAITRQVGDCKVVVSSKGGMVSEFQWGDKDIFYPRQSDSGRKRGGNQICSPYFGKLDKFPNWPRHGWFREKELNLETWEDNRIDCLSIPLERNDCFKNIYATLTHTLSASGLLTSLSISAYLSSLSLLVSPINPGFRPYFPTFGECQIISGYEPIVQIKKADQGKFPAKLFPYPNFGRIGICNKNGTTIMILSGDFSPDSSIVVWSDKVEEYICIGSVFQKVGEYVELGKNEFSREIELCVAFIFVPH